jgi:hypothetical protein
MNNVHEAKVSPREDVMTGNLAAHDFAHASSLHRGATVAKPSIAFRRVLRGFVLRCLRLASYEAWAAGIGAVLTIAGIAFACTISADALAPLWDAAPGKAAAADCFLRGAFCIP